MILKVMVKVNDGRRNYGTTVTPARPLCAGFHYVTGTALLLLSYEKYKLTLYFTL